MDEQQQSIAVRKRRSREEVAQIVSEFGASGLGRIEFCRERELRPATPGRYLKRQRNAQAEVAGVNLVAVELCQARAAAGKGDSSGLAITLAGGRRIEVARGFDPPTLAQLLGLLDRV